MTLLELTEPLFQYVCRLNRMARKKAAVDFGSVRAEVQDLFAELAEKSRSDHRLAQQYQKVEMPLIFFTDSMIADGGLPFAGEWNANRIAFERQELAGDERFFDLLDETLAERQEDAAERLAVFYTCLGLGFVGWFVGQPEMLRRKMQDIAPRIRNHLESDESARICSEAYDHTNTSNLPLPVGTRLIGVAIVFIGLILVVAVANIYLFRSSSADLSRALDAISAHEPAADGNR